MRTIHHISDIHFGRVDAAVAEGLVDDLQANPCDLLVISGDFTQRALAKEYQAACDYCQRLPQPQLVVPGNHDIPLYNLFARLFTPLAHYQRFISADLQPYFADEEIAVLGINTARSFTWDWDGFWKDGRVSRYQLTNLKERFLSLPREVFKVVVTHHPFIPPPKERPHGIVKKARRALAEMQIVGVDLLLAGHLHMGYSGDVRTHHQTIKTSILSVQAGTAISTRRRNEPNAYNQIVIHRDRVMVTVRAWDGRGFAPTVVTEYVRHEDVWSPQEQRGHEPPGVAPGTLPEGAAEEAA